MSVRNLIGGVLHQVGDEALQQALTEARVEAQHAQAELAAARAELEALRRDDSGPDPGSPAREPGALRAQWTHCTWFVTEEVSRRQR